MDDKLSSIEQKVMDIANKLARAKKTITMKTLFQKATRSLTDSNEDISVAIFSLILKKQTQKKTFTTIQTLWLMESLLM